MRVGIRVKPGSARTAVGGRHGDALVVAVTARAVDGKATEAALRAVADAFGVRRRDVTLVTGATSRDKVVDIDCESAEPAALGARRDSLLGGPLSPVIPGGRGLRRSRSLAGRKVADMESSAADAPVVTDNAEASRYEMHVRGELAGFVDYRLRGEVISLVHTEVEPAFQGAHLATHLARFTLDDARKRGLSVLPFCPYINSWIKKHPDYADLVPEDRRADFDLSD